MYKYILIYSYTLVRTMHPDALTHCIASFHANLTLFCVLPAILIVGIYFSYKLRLIQVRKMARGIVALRSPSSQEAGEITRFEAISTVLAGNLGTGNISGMAIAIAKGGPGALIWMWIMAFFGAVIQYVSCFLGTKYRIKDGFGGYQGGPMYYLRDGLGTSFLAALFSLCTLFTAFTVGNLAQAHSIALPLKEMGLSPAVIGCSLMVAVALVLIGGLQRLALVASAVVPVKAALYLGCALLIIMMNYDKLPVAISQLFISSNNSEAFFGGIFGFMTMRAMSTGFERGLFATDAGTGIVPIVQATAKSEHPAITGLTSLVAPLVVMMVCTATGLILLLTGAWQSGLESTNMVVYAFEAGLGSWIGKYIVILSLVFFGYTTILGWACCLEKAATYLFGRKWVVLIRWLFIAAVPTGVFFDVDLVWALADICISLMLLTNMVGIVGLSKEVFVESEDYFRLESKNAQ